MDWHAISWKLYWIVPTENIRIFTVHRHRCIGYNVHFLILFFVLFCFQFFSRKSVNSFVNVVLFLGCVCVCVIGNRSVHRSHVRIRRNRSPFECSTRMCPFTCKQACARAIQSTTMKGNTEAKEQSWKCFLVKEGRKIRRYLQCEEIHIALDSVFVSRHHNFPKCFSFLPRQNNSNYCVLIFRASFIGIFSVWKRDCWTFTSGRMFVVLNFLFSPRMCLLWKSEFCV